MRVHNKPPLQTDTPVKTMCIHTPRQEQERRHINQTCKLTSIPITKPYSTPRGFWTEEKTGGGIFNIFIAKQVICLR